MRKLTLALSIMLTIGFAAGGDRRGRHCGTDPSVSIARASVRSYRVSPPRPLNRRRHRLPPPPPTQVWLPGNTPGLLPGRRSGQYGHRRQAGGAAGREEITDPTNRGRSEYPPKWPTDKTQGEATAGLCQPPPPRSPYQSITRIVWFSVSAT